MSHYIRPNIQTSRSTSETKSNINLILENFTFKVLVFYFAKRRVNIEEKCSVDVMAGIFSEMSLIPTVFTEISVMLFLPLSLFSLHNLPDMAWLMQIVEPRRQRGNHQNGKSYPPGPSSGVVPSRQNRKK